MSGGPIFIGGMQRSGTSLLRAIIGSHPDVAIFQYDLQLWKIFYERYKDTNLDKSSNLTQLLNDIYKSKKVRNAQIKPDREVVEQHINVASPGKITLSLVYQCFLEEYAKRVGRKRWGLKTPHNEFYSRELFSAHPDATMIQIVRDPRDVAVSYLGYDLMPNSFIGPQHIDQWKRSFQWALYNEQHFNDSFLCIYYEELVNYPEKIIKQICNKSDLEYQPSMLKMDSHISWRGTNSSFNDTKEKKLIISNSAIGRYKSYLPIYYKYLYSTMLRNELLHCNYDIEHFNLTQRLKFKPKLYLENLTSRSARDYASLLHNSPLYKPARFIYRKVLEPLKK